MLMSSSDYDVIAGASTIANKLAPISRRECLFLESLKIFNMHYLMAIRKKKAEGRSDLNWQLGFRSSELKN